MVRMSLRSGFSLCRYQRTGFSRAKKTEVLFVVCTDLSLEFASEV